jgi:hypothetical protein
MEISCTSTHVNEPCSSIVLRRSVTSLESGRGVGDGVGSRGPVGIGEGAGVAVKVGGGAVSLWGEVGRTAAKGVKVGNAVRAGVAHAVNSRAALKTGATMTNHHGFLSRSTVSFFIYVMIFAPVIFH